MPSGCDTQNKNTKDGTLYILNVRASNADDKVFVNRKTLKNKSDIFKIGHKPHMDGCEQKKHKKNGGRGYAPVGEHGRLRWGRGAGRGTGGPWRGGTAPAPRGVGGEDEGCKHGYLIFSNHYLESKDLMNI